MSIDNQSVRTSVTLYEDQKDFLQKYADTYFRGKLSRALQHMIEEKMGENPDIRKASVGEPSADYPARSIPPKKTESKTA